MGLLDETIGRIHPLDREAMYKAQKRWDDLYVGVGDFGKLEMVGSWPPYVSAY